MNFSADLDLFFNKMKADIIRSVIEQMEIHQAVVSKIEYNNDGTFKNFTIKVWDGNIEREIPFGCLLFSSDFMPSHIKFDRFRLPLKMRFGNDHLVDKDQDGKYTIKLNQLLGQQIYTDVNVEIPPTPEQPQPDEETGEVPDIETPSVPEVPPQSPTIKSTIKIGTESSMIVPSSLQAGPFPVKGVIMGTDMMLSAEIEIDYTDFNVIFEFLPENDSTADIHEEGDDDDLSSLKGLKDGKNGGMKYITARMYPKIAVGDTVLVREIAQPNGTIKYF